METLDHLIKIKPFWDDSYKFLNYQKNEFSNNTDVTKWLSHGYSNNFTGFMCDMKNKQPEWNTEIIKKFESFGWKDVCTTYYRMDTGTILPVHKDLYLKYIELFGLKSKKYSVNRSIIFLEDWDSGHYFELNNVPLVNWKKGYCVMWNYDTPHMAANVGLNPRYTLQITGHV
jgi:hypothetical protein